MVRGIPDLLHAFSVVCVVVYVTGLLAAGLWDLVAFRIPNAVVLGISVAGLAARLAVAHNPSDVLIPLAVALLVLLVGAVLFAVRIWGAGDAKLLAAIVLWTGSTGLLDLIFWTAVIGGALAAVLLMLRRLPFLKQIRVKYPHIVLLSQSAGVPYGIALAAGGIIAFLSHQTVLADLILPH